MKKRRGTVMNFEADETNTRLIELEVRFGCNEWI